MIALPWIVTLHFEVQFSLLTNHYYDLCLNKLLICCLLIVSKVVVKFRSWVGLVIWSCKICAYILINNQYINRHAKNN